MRGPLASMVDELLSENSLRNRGFYEPAAARRLIDADRRGIEDNAMVIWTMLTTELWFRTFIDAKLV
jgi:asparagine synthase (glutamine-hydrolysing)